MFQVSESAVMVLEATKRQQGIPAEFGIRVAGAAASDGELGVTISFAGNPDDGDIVDEQHGARVFIAADVAEPLAGAELDVSVAESGNGSTPTRPTALVLRPRDDPTQA